MPIVRFTFNAEDVPAGAVNVREGSEGATKVWLWDEYTGLCLADREINGRDDSDFYMVVWDAEKNEPFNYTYASTRGWTYPSYASCVDATDEVKAAYQAWWDAEQEKQRAAEMERVEQRRAYERSLPQKGRTVQVVKGRKVPIGTVGECFWKGPGHYGERVGIRTAAGEEFWTAADNCQVAQGVRQHS